MTTEEWRPIAQSEGQYEVSSCGRLRSLKNGKCLVLSQRKTRSGYLAVRLMIKGIAKHLYTHCLVARAFIPTDDTSRMQVNHINSDKVGNRVENLEWVTQSQNKIHADENSARTKLGADVVLGIAHDVLLLRRGTTETAKKWGVCFQNVTDIKSGRRHAKETAQFRNVHNPTTDT